MRIAAITWAVLFSASLAADSVSVPNTLSNNTPADADDVQENFQALVEESNENDQRIADAEDSIGTLESYFPSDQTKYVSSSGWYTIAYIPCSSVVGGSCTYDLSGKGSAYFIIRSDTGPKHQTTVLYASAIFGMVQLQVLHNQIYSQQPFTAARIRDGGAYHGALLQIQVDTTANISLTARLASREQEGSDSYAMPGWIQTNWTPDGDALDSIDYTLLTTEAMREIPTEVQYLSEFSCTAGQILEWNNTRSQWECADLSDIPSVGLPTWVDSLGQTLGYFMVNPNSTTGDHPIVRLEGDDVVYMSNYNASRDSCNFGSAQEVYYTQPQCAGDAYLMAGSGSYTWLNVLGAGYNGNQFRPVYGTENLNSIALQSRSSPQADCSVICVGSSSTASVGSLLEAEDTLIPNDHGSTPPNRLVWE